MGTRIDGNNLAAALKHLETRIAQRKLYTYRPYGHPDTLCPDGSLWKEKYKTGEWNHWSNKPWQLEFHNAGKDHQERCILAANRPGKTLSAAFEVAFHMTGEYPEWWEGKRFDKPVLSWSGSPTNETSRDVVQKALLGGIDKENIGTGTIPREKIIGSPKTRQAGVSEVVDSFKVRHISGGVSIAALKTYEQGWRKWMGAAPEIVWLDEEPEDNEIQGKIRTESLTRLLTSRGIMMCTLTPLLGQTKLVRHFQEGGKGIWLGSATWDDAPHINIEERERMIASYEDYEVASRTTGVPMMGEGRVFTTHEDEIKISPIHIPSHWARIKGVDFGIDHPSAIVDCAWDRDNDIWYIVGTWRKKGAEHEEHADAINSNDPWVPVAWPHDGTNREKSSGVRLKDFYVQRGVKMLGKPACYKNDKLGGQPVEPIILEMQGRARSGGLRVFATCNEFFDEYRNYHRKDGKLVKTRDDVLKASFYALMMRRYAATRNVSYSASPPPPSLSMRR